MHVWSNSWARDAFQEYIREQVTGHLATGSYLTAPATPSGWLYEPETRCRGLLIPKDLKSSLWRAGSPRQAVSGSEATKPV